MIPRVAADFPDIANHVIESPGVWLFEPDRAHASARVAAVPGDVVEFRAVDVQALAAPRAAGILPLRFRGNVRRRRSPRGIVFADLNGTEGIDE